MHSWSSDRELELACKVGAIPSAKRALREGADVNCDGGSPLFLAIMARERGMMAFLLEQGADPATILPAKKLKDAKTPEAVLEALWACCPPELTPEEKADDGKEVLKDDEATA